MQIREVKITNFRCMRDVTISFEPLTVLVGPNASGKSTLLKALQPGTNWGGLADQWQKRPDAKVGIEVTYREGPIQRMPVSGHTYNVLRLDLSKLRKANQVEEANALDSSGGNLANVFGTLTRRKQEELAEQFCRLVPMFDDIDVRPLHAGQHQVLFHDRWADVWYEPVEVSDGTMLVLAFLLIQHQRDSVDVLAIEEPERGLHPWLLGEIVKLLRSIGRGEVGGRETQVILATHSAELLEFLQPEEVRFLSRDPADGAVRVTTAPTQTTEWRAAFDEYRHSLGEAWLSGGLGGVPG